MFSHPSKKISAVLWFVLLLTFHSPASGAVPAAPSGLAALAGNGEIHLTWNAVEGASGYVLYRGQASSGPYDYLARTSGTAHRDGNVGNGATYFYVVTALNAEGQSPYSAEVGMATNPAVLRAPTGLLAAPGNGQVSLAWEAVTSAVSYNVYRAASPGGPYTLLAPAATGPGFTDNGAANGTRYYYAVQTMSDTPGALSDETDATPSPLLPVAPASLTVTPGSTWASLAWSPSPGATGYAIYRGTHTGGPYAFAALANTTSWEDTSLTNGTVYYYVVAAVNAIGRGAFSEEASADVNLNQRPHAALLTAKPADGAVYLYWNNPPGAVSFTLHRSDGGGNSRTFPPTQLAGFTDLEVVNGTTYYYTLAVHNASGTDAGSNTVAVTPSVQLPAPSGLAVTPGNTEITATWYPVAGVIDYYAVVSQAPGGEGTPYWPDGPSFTATGLTNGQIYHVRVQSRGNTGSSPFVTEAGVTPSSTLPLSPTGLHIEPAGQAGNRQISVDWDAVSGATGYEVYRRPQGGVWGADPVGIVTATLFNDSGLTNDTAYCYKVAAVNATGQGAWSVSEVCSTPVAAALPAPTDVMVVAGNTQATLTWTPVVGAVNYFITGATSPGGVYATGTNSGSSPSVTLGGLTNGTPYYFRIQAVGNGVRTSAYSAEVSVTPSSALPLATTSLNGAAGGNTEATLSWSVVDGATGYRIYRRSDDGYWSSIPIGTTAEPIFADSGLTNGKSYTYKVAAVNATGQGAWSEGEISVTPRATALFAPINLRFIPGNTQATLTWDPVIGATGYYVILSTGGAYASLANVGISPNFTANGLENGKTSRFRIQAAGYLASGSSYSAASGGAPLATLPLAPTGNISLTQGNTQLSLTWNAAPGATGYEIHRRPAAGAWPISLAGTTAGTLFTDSGLANGATFFYTVSAVNSAGGGAWSYETSGSASASAAFAPTNVTAIAGNGQVTVSWNAVAGAADYYVVVATSPGGPQVAGALSGGATSWIVGSLANGTPYYFRVQAWVDGQWSAFSPEASAVPSLPADHGTLFGRISVNFAGNSDLGVANATVSLGSGYQTTTDANGNFVLSNVLFDTYTLVVSAPGMETKTVAVTMSDTSQTVPAAQTQMTVALQAPGIPGDVNGDGVLDIADVLYILQVLTGIRPSP